MMARAFRLAGALLILVVVPSAQAADDGKELVATWHNTSDGIVQYWTIKESKGAWTVDGIYKRGNQEIGSFQGKDPRFADGKLTFIQEFKVKPVASWDSGSTIVVAVQDGKLQFAWKNGLAMGKGVLELLKK